MYLLSVCAMAGDMAILTVDLLLNVVARTGIMYAHYVDAQGQQQPTGMAFVVQVSHSSVAQGRLIAELLLGSPSSRHWYLFFGAPGYCGRDGSIKVCEGQNSPMKLSQSQI